VDIKIQENDVITLVYSGHISENVTLSELFRFAEESSDYAAFSVPQEFALILE